MEMMEKATVFAEGKTFKDLGLRQELVEACYKLGWTTPTIIQAEAISHALEGRDLIGLAQTGSGKTGAFALPILQKFLDTTKRHPFFACIVAPTRELAAQICKDFEDLGSSVGVKCAVIMGGTSKMEQAIALAKRPDILVATPGRLLDHLTNTKGFCLRTLKYLVLDEADKLLNADFEKAIGEIVQAAPRERNTYLFSATMTEKVRRLKRACLRNPTKVEASSKYSTNDTLTQQFVFLPANQKDFYLVYILNKMAGRTSMVFTRTCESTRLLALTLRNLGLKAIPLNGHMSEANRLESLHKFQAGEYNILVCTDVGSRGLDMEVDLVINYDIPQNSKDYCHRVGRTARAGRFGTAISLVNQYEVAWFSQIEERIKKKLTLFPTKEAKVLLLCDQVAEAKKIALKSIRDSKEKKRKKFEDEDEDGSDVQVKSRKTKKADKMRLKS